ncbi:hypothetical protein CAEBREN_25964 [Caenorhabditis brenneri]|uniref:SPK domain-containing protein n=1 Tax=Caenorhabditis brenneri TaxID=135651 RepID=G0NSY3_CAEBE|nr:hypothetical protein CAEBREN_25964 [Caenorhabditis brenneri]
MSSPIWSTADQKLLLTFLLKTVSNCTEILQLTDIGRKFMSEHPLYRNSKGLMSQRIRSLLDKIEADDHDATTLAKLMFCFFHPLQNLQEIKTKLSNSGVLVVCPTKYQIKYYKDKNVELIKPGGEFEQWLQKERNYQERLQRVIAGRQMRLEIEMLKEAHEMGERAKAEEDKQRKIQQKQMKKEEVERFQNENIQRQIEVKRENEGLVDQNGGVGRFVFQEVENAKNDLLPTKTPKPYESETVPERIEQIIKEEDEQAEIPPLAAKRARIEEVTYENSDFALSIQPMRDQELEGDDSVSLPTSASSPAQSNEKISQEDTPAPSIIGSQENKLDYRFLLRSILNYSRVMNSNCFEGLQSEILEELNEPDVVSKQVSEHKVAEAIREGIKATTTRLKAEPLHPSISISLPEFFRFWQLKLFEMEFEKENELVKEISSLIQNPNLQVAVKLYNIRLGLEMTLKKLRQ